MRLQTALQHSACFSMESKLLSIVIPVYNEEHNLPLVHEELSCALSAVDDSYSFEVIFINDGSTDDSWKVISEIAEKDPVVSGIALSRNFGHQAALEAGFVSARGDAIIMMDADLEQPPSLIPEMINKWELGNLIVNTTRESNRESRSFIKRLTSKYFYKFFNMISDVPIQSASCDFRLIDRKVLDEMLKIKEDDRFFSGLVAWVGFPSVVIEYKDGVRIHGVPGYNYRKLVNLALIAMTSFSTVPLKLIIPAGLLIFVSSTLLIMMMTLVNIVMTDNYFSDLAFLVVFIIINNGIIMTALGIVAVYLLRIHKTVQGKPKFVIGTAVGNIQ